MIPIEITVSLGSRSYPILIGEGLLAQLGALLRQHAKNINQALLVTDEHVAAHWLRPVLDALEAADINTQYFVIAPGEASKSFASLDYLLDSMLESRPDRQTAILALGGGVVGDLAGFAASILLRGVPFIQIPTTLLAMVDSSVGGKTGINAPQGKNLIGSFYQPSLVVMDTSTLATLPERELRSGMAEVIKYGCISNSPFTGESQRPQGNAVGEHPPTNSLRSLAPPQGGSGFFEWLEQTGMRDLATAIETSCRIKAEIVGQDEREESGQRALLNFGHSFGHALEAECGYDGTLLHGEAVAIGMVMAAELSAQLGYCNADIPPRIRALLKQSGLPVSPRDIRAEWKLENLINRMKSDKKNQSGKINLILLRNLGEAFICSDVTEDQLRDLWQTAISGENG